MPQHACAPRALALLASLVLAAALPARAQSDSFDQLTAGAAALNWDWRWDARVQLDHARFGGVYTRDGATASTTYLRRANLGGAVRWHPQWSAGADLELDSDDQLTLDAWAVHWAPRDTLSLRLGRIDPDFGLEQTTSSSWSHGVERSAVWDLAPDVADAEGGTGLRADGHGTGWHASAGLYDKRGSSALVGRVVAQPAVDRGARLHLGASLARSLGWQGDGRIRTRLGVRGVTEDAAGRRSTLGRAAGLPQAYDSDTSVGVEAAWQQGAWMLQAEALQRRLGGTGGQAGRTAQGAYVLLAWAITGEPRRYDEARGRFRSARPADPRRGAWEVFYRLDSLDVDDGRSATVHTAGLGWTADTTWRALLNVHSARSGDANASDQATGMAWSARLQAVF